MKNSLRYIEKQKVVRSVKSDILKIISEVMKLVIGIFKVTLISACRDWCVVVSLEPILFAILSLSALVGNTSMVIFKLKMMGRVFPCWEN